jgi:hypothetical protein
MMVTLKAENVGRTGHCPRAPHQSHLTTPPTVLIPRQSLQILTRGPGFPTTRISMPSDDIRERYCRIAFQYTSQRQCVDDSFRLPTIPCASGLGAWAIRARATKKTVRHRPRSGTANPRLDSTERGTNTPVTKTEIMDHCTAEYKMKFTRG